MYNEGPNLTPLLLELKEVLQALEVQGWEILVINDGSLDDTGAILRKNLGDGVRGVELEQNCGQSAAMEVGFRSARGHVIVTMDSDLQNDPRDIPRLLEALPGYDLVCGVRVNRRDTPLRRLSSRVANLVRSQFTQDGCSDTGCSLKAFRTEALRQIPMFRGSHRFLPALFLIQGFRSTEIPVHHRPRVAGDSKYGLLDRLFATVPDLLAVTWMRHRRHRYRAREVSRG